MELGRTRSIVELVTNVAIAGAAIALVWRLVLAPAPAPAAAAAGGNRPPAIEDIAGQKLSVDLPAVSRKGAKTAPVVLLEFSDYECPFCGRYATSTYAEVDKAFVATNRIQYAFKNLPLPMHAQAKPAAAAAECAGAQGKYWEMHDRLFANQDGFKDAVWNQAAGALGLDMAAFEACLGSMEPKINTDLTDAGRVGAVATPTFFVGRLADNNRVQLLKRINGAQPFAEFERALNDVLDDVE
jgi:protein-disulfide isomerase